MKESDKMKLRTKDIILCALFAALMGIGANVAPFLTIGSVPITFQLLFAIMAGGLLGSRLGAISMMAYIFIGLAGAPVFAGFKGGIGILVSPTFGFIISFILVAYIVGKFTENEKENYIVAGFLVLVMNYIIGTNLMYLAMKFWAAAPEGFSYGMAWSWMVLYLPLDIVVTVISLTALPKVKAALKLKARYSVDV